MGKQSEMLEVERNCSCQIRDLPRAGQGSVQLQLSDSFYVYRTLAIISVVAAHCVYQDTIIRRISSMIGTAGVPIFLFAAGYFAKLNEPAEKFWHKKLENIIIPWILYGMITYGIGVILGRTFSFSNLIQWILGNGTWFYFVPVLLGCFVIYRIGAHQLYIVLTFIVFIISNMLTSFDLVDYPSWLTKYQLVTNWCGFFAMGVLIAKEELISYLCELHIVWKLSVWVGWVLFSIGYVLFCDTPSYWSAVALPYEVLSMAAWFLFAYSLRNFNILIDIGKKTYIIYFLHMQLGIGFSTIQQESLILSNMNY